jgi:hypothetical protein
MYFANLYYQDVWNHEYQIYMKYVTFPRPLLVAAQERKGLAVALHSSRKLLAAEKLSLYPGFGYVHQILLFRSNCTEDNFRPQLPLL